ncbi:MAG: hypothetical protein EBT00_08555 [Proteobacteria bacterium]|nr:hypothetical protein [Pseudomonadota bacterium]
MTGASSTRPSPCGTEMDDGCSGDGCARAGPQLPVPPPGGLGRCPSRGSCASQQMAVAPAAPRQNFAAFVVTTSRWARRTRPRWVRCSPDDEERTFAGYDPEAGGLIIDRSASSLDPEVTSTVVITPVTVDIHSPFTIRIFLDASVLEVFLEDATGCIANLGGRIYPSRTDSLQSRVHGEAFAGGDSWVMAGIWPD